MKAKFGSLNFIAVFLLTIASAGTTGQESGRAASGPSGHSDDFRISLSVSPFTEMVLKTGIMFTDGKNTAQTPEELQRLFMKYGSNEVYARIATSHKSTPGFGDHSLELGLARARMARSLGLPFNPEVGLFKVYGDLRCQPSPDFSEYPELKVPGPWESLQIEQMLPVLRAYGATVAKAILDTGVKVRIWDLGNEVELGMAGVAPRPIAGQCEDYTGGPGWYKAPDKIDAEIGKKTIEELLKMPEADRIAWLQAHIWPYLARMFVAVAEGIRSVDPGAKFSTHVSGATAPLPQQAVAFYKAMREGGFVPDELGFSFYPTFTNQPPDRLEAFKQTVISVRKEFHRPVFLAEFAYAAASDPSSGIFSSSNAIEHYPLTPQGQADFMRDLADWGKTRGLSGIRPWGPDTAISVWQPFALFEVKGKTAVARPALAAIEAGVQATNH